MNTTKERLEALIGYKKDMRDALKQKGVLPRKGFSGYADAIRSIDSGGSGFTGHLDVEGLKAIGWTDTDIEEFQTYGIDWNEEEDDNYKVSDVNKAMYGTLTAADFNTAYTSTTHRPKTFGMVWLPKIDFSAATKVYFSGCWELKGIPSIDISKVTGVYTISMFLNCYALTYCPSLTINSTSMATMFGNCIALRKVSSFYGMENVTAVSGMFEGCKNITEALDIPSVKITTFANMYSNTGIKEIPQYDYSVATTVGSMLSGCDRLEKVPNIGGAKLTTVTPFGTANGGSVSLSALFTMQHRCTEVGVIETSPSATAAQVTGTTATAGFKLPIGVIKFGGIKDLKYSFNFNVYPMLSAKSVHNIINQAQGGSDDSPITLTFEENVKARWMASEYYEDDSVMLETKFITIA